MRPHDRSPDSRTPGEIAARRRARRWAMTGFYALVVVFIVIAAGNVTWQVWAPAFRAYSPIDCREGLRALTQAIDRARQEAQSLSDASEDQALTRFRIALQPEWDEHDRVAASCHGNPALAEALDVIERLRYAEERAVRREVHDLAPLRRRVSQLAANQLLR